MPISLLEGQLNKTVSIVFDDESEALYGDLLDNKLHLNKICDALVLMAEDKPKSIFIDMDITVDPIAAECIADAAEKNDLRITVDYDPSLISVELEQKLKVLSVGTAKTMTKVMDGYEYEAPTSNSAVHWLNPRTRVELVKPAVTPYIMPAYFISLVSGLPEELLNQVRVEWSRKVTLSEFSESKTPKIPLQQVLEGETGALADKYVFIGVDQDKYDAMSNSSGEIVNGVFVHQQFLAAYLSLLELEREPESGSMIIFGEY